MEEARLVSFLPLTPLSEGEAAHGSRIYSVITKEKKFYKEQNLDPPNSVTISWLTQDQNYMDKS